MAGTVVLDGEARSEAMAAAEAYLARSGTGEMAFTIYRALKADGVIGNDVEVRHLKAAMSESPRFVRHGRHIWRLAGREYRRTAAR